MVKWRKTFEDLSDKFLKKKPFFQRKLEQFKSRGKTTLYEKAQALYAGLEKESAEIKQMFVDGVSAVEEAALKSRIKVFKKMYKKLHESSKPAWRQWLEALLVAGVLALLLRNFIFGLYHVPTGSAEPTILVGDRVWGNKMAYFISEVERGDQVIFDDPRYRYNKSNWLKHAWQKYVGLPIPLLGISGGPINMVKRVIAVPGDWIEGRIEDGKTVIYLNGKRLEESYVNPYPLIWLRKTRGLLPFSSIGPIPVPPFLQERPIKEGVFYTYDPSKSFEDQPFYSMDKSEVIRIPGYPSLQKPYTPSYKHYGGKSADVFGPMRVPEGKYWVMGDSRKNSKDSRWFGFLDKSLIHGRLSFIIYSIDSQEPFWILELIKHPISFWTKAIRWNRFLKKEA